MHLHSAGAVLLGPCSYDLAGRLGAVRLVPYFIAAAEVLEACKQLGETLDKRLLPCCHLGG